jgi:alginate O-acetyltransferase complex protein AlgI
VPFNSYLFLFVFFPVAAIGALTLRKSRAFQWWLLILSVIFLSIWDYRLVPLIAAVTVAVWASAAMMFRRPDHKTAWCAAGLAVLALNFVYFRAHSASVGVSFFTFNLASLLVDTHRGRIEVSPSLKSSMTFAMCFVYVMAGPLVRWNDVKTSLASGQDADTGRFVRGLFMLTSGLAKKVLVADAIALRLNHLLTLDSSGGALGAWLAALAFAAQIYFDFSGYSDMAVGVGLLLGIDLPQNFSAPYRATQPADFWRRWHMSLSAWVRDYVYLSLGLGRSRARAIFNIFIAMLFVGLWHGIAWTFVLWGLYHAVLLAAYHLSQTNPAWRQRRLPPLIGRTATFVAVTVGWALFRSDSLEMAAGWLGRLAGTGGIGNVTLLLNQAGRPFPLMVAAALVATQLLPESYEVRPKATPVWAAGLGVLLALSLMSMGGSNPFLYMQF